MHVMRIRLTVPRTRKVHQISRTMIRVAWATEEVEDMYYICECYSQKRPVNCHRWYISIYLTLAIIALREVC